MPFLPVHLLLAHSSKYKTFCHTIYSQQQNIAAVAPQQTGTLKEKKISISKQEMSQAYPEWQSDYLPAPLLSREPP